ncbi:MAG: Smr/MutS family protein [bacterium]|nr:Smr/MutS family protein [bacterium]
MKHQNKYLEKIQAEIDLHGFTKNEANIALGNFLKDAENKKYKKVRIITGKGLHSESGRGVLSEYIKKALESKGLKYSNAKISEGGDGAIDVELD